MNHTDKHKIFNIRYDILICLFLVIATLAAYWQVMNYPFVNFDDDSYILKNHFVQEGLTWEGILWAFSFKSLTFWHPMVWLSHMLDYHIYGLIPGMHHSVGLIFHIANSLLVFMALKQMTGALWRSAFVAALFALHPINVESVAWVAERKNVLSAFFWMLTMLTYISYSKQLSFYRYITTILLFVLGLMAKPVLVTLPFVFLLLDYWPLQRLRFGQNKTIKPRVSASGFQESSVFRLILEKIPFFVFSAVSIYISSLAFQHNKMIISTESVPMKLRIANALVSYISYIKKMIWPDNLAIFYPYPDALPLWQITGTGLILIGISILVLWRLKSKPYLAVGWFWYIGTLMPVIGLVQAGLWPAMADRYAYVPLIGLFIFLAWGAGDIASKLHYKKILPAVIAGILLIFAITTWEQIRYWSSSVALFKHALDVTGVKNYIAHYKLGDALAEEGRNAEAIKHYHEALRTKYKYWPGIYLNLGVALMSVDKINESIDSFSKAIQIKPDFAEAYNNMGIAMEKQGDFTEAARHYREALRIKHDYAEAHNNLGVVLAKQGNFSEAIKHYLKALQISSKYESAHNNLGNALAYQGNYQDAIYHYKEALRINPNYIEAYYNLEKIYANREKNEKGIEINK
ncbi:MAG: tetratricopeptide repeat protein [Desulfobacterales bacterium]